MAATNNRSSQSGVNVHSCAATLSLLEAAASRFSPVIGSPARIVSSPSS